MIIFCKYAFLLCLLLSLVKHSSLKPNLITFRNLSYTSSNSISECIAYENDPNYKWCRSISETTSGYFCSIDDTSSFCGGTPDYVCSTNTKKFPNNSKRFLCPKLESSCGPQTYELNNLSDVKSIRVNPLNNIICWYKFKSSTNIIKSLTLTLRRTSNAIVEVYLEKTNSRFSYKGDLTSSTLNINTENDQYAIWVLMMPKGTDASTSGFRVTPSEFVASSSSKKSNFVLIISVVSGAVGFIYFVVIFIVVIVILIKRYRNKRKQKFYGPESRSDQTKNNKTEELDKEEQLTIGEENKEDIRCSSPKDFDEKLKYIEKNQECLKDLGANRDSCFELIGENKNTTADNTQSSLNSIKHFEVTVRNVWYENTSNTVVKSN